MKTLALSLVLAASPAVARAACESRVCCFAEIVSVPVQLVAATTKEKTTKSSAPTPSAPSPEKPKAPAAPPREQKPAPPAVLFM